MTVYSPIIKGRAFKWWVSMWTLYFLLRSYLTAIFRFGEDVRLAHAYRSGPSAKDVEDLDEVLRILNGDVVLAPRPPADATAVIEAETSLDEGLSPVYTFVGCLHPDLGTIGLVIDPGCANRCLRGVTRCDTGGLAGRRGSFAHLTEMEATAALVALTFTDGLWIGAFSHELATSYVTTRAYVAGSIPRYDLWDDIRAKCISAHQATATANPDRRLWSWEMRLFLAPYPSEYEGLILSPEAFKKLDFLQRSGRTVPQHVRIVRGRAEPSGIHHFEERPTIAVLCGRRVP